MDQKEKLKVVRVQAYGTKRSRPSPVRRYVERNDCNLWPQLQSTQQLSPTTGLTEFRIHSEVRDPDGSHLATTGYLMAAPAEGLVGARRDVNASAINYVGVVEVHHHVDGDQVAYDTTSPDSGNSGASSPASFAVNNEETAMPAAASPASLKLARRLLVPVVALAALFGGVDQAAAAAETACERPYSSSSPWNTPIGSSPSYRADSAAVMAGIEGPLSSDPTQYTYPVYYVTALTPTRTVRISGWFSNVTDGGRTLANQRGGTTAVRIPAAAEAAAGSDGQLIIIDPATGDEWGFWRLGKDASGDWYATNGYHYNIGWSAVPPTGFVSRGAGVPYTTGLVRPCEIARGRIDHALAFAYDYPGPEFIYPATKSDGDGTGVSAVPEGTRFQLDPRITEAQIIGWGCTGPCLTIAKALQTYGMYVVDNSGRPKVMLEYEGTANWAGALTHRTVNPIPLTAFKVLQRYEPPAPAEADCTVIGTAGRDVLVGTAGADVICGNGGNDVIHAGGGADSVLAGYGDDVVYAGPGDDTLYAGRGNDVVNGGLGRDRIVGGPGADRANGGASADRLYGGFGPDFLVGARGPDLLAGGSGRDALHARDGRRDRVSGGAGRDRGRVDRLFDLVRSVETIL